MKNNYWMLSTGELNFGTVFKIKYFIIAIILYNIFSILWDKFINKK
jgi:hypothetical protein